MDCVGWIIVGCVFFFLVGSLYFRLVSGHLRYGALVRIRAVASPHGPNYGWDEAASAGRDRQGGKGVGIVIRYYPSCGHGDAYGVLTWRGVSCYDARELTPLW